MSLTLAVTICPTLAGHCEQRRVHGAGLEGDRRPLQVAELGHSQAVPEADQDHGRIAVAVAVALGRLDQVLDLELREMLPIATRIPIAGPAQRYCP